MMSYAAKLAQRELIFADYKHLIILGEAMLK